MKQDRFDGGTTDASVHLLATTDRERKKRSRKVACWCVICFASGFLLLAALVGVIIVLEVALNQLPDDPYERALALLDSYPLIDG